MHRPAEESIRGVSLDNFVDTGEQQWRHREAERLGGLEIDDQLEPSRLLNGQVGSFLAFENSSGVDPFDAVGGSRLGP
jgi:hypothetical protein